MMTDTMTSRKGFLAGAAALVGASVPLARANSLVLKKISGTVVIVR